MSIIVFVLSFQAYMIALPHVEISAIMIYNYNNISIYDTKTMLAISLKQLRVFVKTVEHGKISIAAEHCFMTQPAASMALQHLEEALAVPLFDRAGKRLLINDNGKALFPKARQLLDQAGELTGLFSSDSTELTGTLHIGCSRTIGKYILPSIIATFKQQHPNLTIDVSIDNTERLIQQLSNLSLDCALIEGQVPKDPSLKSLDWKEDKLVIIARKNHPLASQQKNSAKQLGKYSWVMREPGSGTADWLQQQAYNQFTLNIEIILNDFEAIKNYVAHSDCLSCISQSALEHSYRSKLTIVPSRCFDSARQLSYVTHQHKYPSRALIAFKEHIDQ